MELPDLKLLHAAIVLAEFRHYSRAAKRLGIQQPTLTKRIVELEQFVGFKLFLRSTQYVEPTDACRRLVQESKEAVFHAERAIQVARAAEKGAEAVLHVGKTQYIDPYLLSMLNAVSLPLYPNLQLLLSNMTSHELEQEVRLGKLDLAVITGSSADPKITQLELARTPFYVLLPDASPWAKKFELTLKDLKGLRWSLFDRNIHPGLYDAILGVAQEDDSAPLSLHHVATAEEAAQFLYAGISEVAFLTKAGAWRVAQNGLTIRPLQDDRLWLVSRLIAREDNTSRLVSEFTRKLKTSLETPRRLQLNLPLYKGA
jgi:DNA-binding transcriptional LysR family regulator